MELQTPRPTAKGPAQNFAGDVYVAGETTSTNFPGTTGGAQATEAGNSDGFVALLNGALTSLIQVTYLGGTKFDEISAIAIASSTGDVYVAGRYLVPATHDAVLRLAPEEGVIVVRSKEYLEGEEIR